MLDHLSAEKRREILLLVVEQVPVDRHNNVNITLGIPTEDLSSIEQEESPSPPRGQRNRRRGHRRGRLEPPSYEIGNEWWATLESNQGPQSYQDCALTD